MISTKEKTNDRKVSFRIFHSNHEEISVSLQCVKEKGRKSIKLKKNILK